MNTGGQEFEGDAAQLAQHMKDKSPELNPGVRPKSVSLWDRIRTYPVVVVVGAVLIFIVLLAIL